MQTTLKIATYGFADATGKAPLISARKQSYVPSLGMRRCARLHDETKGLGDLAKREQPTQ